MNIACFEEINYDIIEENINENNSRETEEFMSRDNLFEKQNYRRGYDQFKYKDIDDQNIDNSNFGRNKQILINDKNVYGNIKDKECYNSTIYEACPVSIGPTFVSSRWRYSSSSGGWHPSK